MILNIIIAVIATFLIIYLLKKKLGVVLVSYIIIIQYLWMFYSLIVIEDGIFINEQGRNGYFIYSSIILFIFFLSTLLSLVFFNSLFTKILNKEKSIRFKFLKLNEEKLIIYGVSLTLLIAFFNLIASPIPFFNANVTKFNFWEFARYPFLEKVLGNVIGFVAFGSALIFNFSKKRSLILLTLYLVYLLLIGQKFSGFLIGSYAFFVAYYFSNTQNIKFKLSWIFNKYSLLIGISIFSLVLYYYTIKNPFAYMGLTPLESIFYRTFGLQAHVFWGTAEQYVYLNKANTWKITELWNGMRLLMKEFWPWDLESYHSVTSRGVSWTNAYPAILLRIFPWPIAVIANFLLLSFVALTQSLLIFFIQRKSYLLSIIMFQLLTWVSFAFTMGYFSKLVAPIIFISILLIFKLLIYEHKSIKNRI